MFLINLIHSAAFHLELKNQFTVLLDSCYFQNELLCNIGDPKMPNLLQTLKIVPTHSECPESDRQIPLYEEALGACEKCVVSKQLSLQRVVYLAFSTIESLKRFLHSFILSLCGIV